MKVSLVLILSYLSRYRLTCLIIVLVQNESFGETGGLSFNNRGERDNFTLFVTALSGDHQIMTVRESTDQGS